MYSVCLQGLQLYDDIFDGRFSTALKRAGGKVVNQFESYILCHPATGLQPWLHTADIKQPIPVAIATRHLFESTARGLLSEDPRVEFKYGKVVTGLLFAGPEAEAPVEKEHEEENAGRRRNGAATAVHGGSAGDGGDGAGNGKQQQQQQVVRGEHMRVLTLTLRAHCQCLRHQSWPFQLEACASPLLPTEAMALNKNRNHSPCQMLSIQCDIAYTLCDLPASSDPVHY